MSTRYHKETMCHLYNGDVPALKKGEVIVGYLVINEGKEEGEVYLDETVFAHHEDNSFELDCMQDLKGIITRHYEWMLHEN